MKTDRLRLQAKFGSLYRWLPTLHDERCFYCGDPAEALDHCPPLSLMDQIGTETFAAMGVRFWLIRTCRECNLILSDRKILTPITRYEYVQHCLRRKHEHWVKYRRWDEDELDDLGPRLRQYVRSGIDISEYLARRLAWFPRLRAGTMP